MKTLIVILVSILFSSMVFAGDNDTKVYTDEDLKKYKSTSEIPKARGEVKSPLDLIKNECDSISSMSSSMSNIELEILLQKLDSAQDTINSMAMFPELKYNALLAIRACREIVKIEFKIRKLKGY